MRLSEIRELLQFRPIERDATARRLNSCLTIEDLRRVARRRLPGVVFDYVDGGADDDKSPSRRGGEYVACELVDRDRRRITEIGDIDGFGHREPNQKDRHEQQSQRQDRAARRRVQHVEDMAGGRIEPGFPAPAQFVETDRGEWPDEREAGRKRECKRQHRGARREGYQAQAEQRINHAEEHSVARHCGKIIETASERLIEIRWCNVTNREICGPCACANEKM